MLKKDEAVCIHCVDYSETSQILVLFCRQSGKISTIAKGSKRAKSAFGGALDVFSHGQVVYSEHGEGKLATLTEFERQGGFPGLRRKLISLNSALFGAELLNSLMTDNDPHPLVFDDFLRFLGHLEEGDVRAVGLLIAFQLSLLGGVGLGLVVERCTNCNRDYDESWPSVFFSSSANGLLCRNCEGSFPDRVQLSLRAAACLADPKQINSSAEGILSEVEKMLVQHFTFMMRRPPRMAKHFVRTQIR